MYEVTVMKLPDSVYLEELSMLVGKVNRDASYLYYLLIKDGSYFKKEEPKVEIKTEATVDSLEDWFSNI